jgi:hypothetical protein
MCGTSLLFAPPSITRTLRFGDASAMRAAMMHPAVPPGKDESQPRDGVRKWVNVPPAMIISTSSMSSASLVYRPISFFRTVEVCVSNPRRKDARGDSKPCQHTPNSAAYPPLFIPPLPGPVPAPSTRPTPFPRIPAPSRSLTLV